MRIAFIGKFNHLWDEEYIARSFEMIGCKVRRIPQTLSPFDINNELLKFKPDILLYCKWDRPQQCLETIQRLKREGMRTVCWLFDIYFGYSREWQVRSRIFFKSDYVFTTDGGHNPQFVNTGVNHTCVRQGIFKDECVLLPQKEIKHNVVFVGSDNPLCPERHKIIKEIGNEFDFKWYGRTNTNEMRGMALNELFSEVRIVVGDSFYSPHYWSNRIVETLGRGGFLIHQEVEGLKEDYPHLVTYKRGDIQDLKNKIQYYLEHEDERQEIVRKNYEWVFNHFTMDKRCQDIIDYVK